MCTKRYEYEVKLTQCIPVLTKPPSDSTSDLGSPGSAGQAAYLLARYECVLRALDDLDLDTLAADARGVVRVQRLEARLLAHVAVRALVEQVHVEGRVRRAQAQRDRAACTRVRVGALNERSAEGAERPPDAEDVLPQKGA